MAAAHRLVLTRSPRWRASCGGCPWVGVPRRSRAAAEAQYRQHVDGADNPHDPGPRQCTPADDLPELLR